YDRLTLDDDGRRGALALARLLGGVSVRPGPIHPTRWLTMAMTPDSQATLLLCSYLGLPSGEKPLTPREWNELSEKLEQPSLMLEMSQEEIVQALEVDEEFAGRLRRLLDRSA